MPIVYPGEIVWSAPGPDATLISWVPGSPLVGHYPPGSRSATAPEATPIDPRVEMRAFGCRPTELVRFQGATPLVEPRRAALDELDYLTTYRADKETG